MALHPSAGSLLPEGERLDVERLKAAYRERSPVPTVPGERIDFGTSGHRGSSFRGSFHEDHVLAMAQAVSDYRKQAGIQGPLFLGKDTHALSEPALETALEVFAANAVPVYLDEALGFTPTPVLSHAILTWEGAAADGVILTPSHNPPEDGGFKYNPPTGGPAEPSITRWIEERANQLLDSGLQGIRRLPFRRALVAETTFRHDFQGPYVEDLATVLNLEAVARSGLRLGADPLGGAGIAYWYRIAETYGIQLEVVNPVVDPTFSFIPRDSDGTVRMDCSSPWAMSGILRLRDRFDLAFGNDPDFDRHGIVTPEGGLMNPNHFLASAVDYLFRHRPEWSPDAGIGKTLVTTSMLDRIAQSLGRPLVEVPVGFKWFVDGLRSGVLAFAGEESAGATFVRKQGRVWTTDKDGILLALLAAEMTAVQGRNPAEQYRGLEETHGTANYLRTQAPANREERAILRRLSPEMVDAQDLAGSPIRARLTQAPGNGADLGGLKVVTDDGWFAARPSGTEEIYKIYAESFRGPEHLSALVSEAQTLVTRAFETAARG